MGNRTQRAAARSPLGLLRFAAAAAVTGITGSELKAAEIPTHPPVVQLPPPIRHKPRTDHIHSSYQTWLGVTGTGPVVPPMLAFVDLVGGFYDDMHPAAVMVRPAVGVELPHRFTIFTGYAYSSFWNEKHERGEEHSAFQQVSYTAPVTVVELSARLRWEQRFRAGSDVAFRLRALTELAIPFGRRSPFRFVMSHEVFFALNQPAAWQPSVLDLDQFFLGFAWTPGPRFRADVGYQGALVPRRVETEMVHCLSISSTVSW